MTTAAWVLLAVLAVAVVWLGLAMAGLLREVTALREELRALAAAPIHLGGGLAVGSRAPEWSLDGATSASMAGDRYLLVFADADCATCDEVLPDVVRLAGTGALPPTVVVGRHGRDIPPSWRGPHVVAGAEHAGGISDAFEVEISPHAFVIDEDGAVVAQGGAVSLSDVEALVRGAAGIRIVPGGDRWLIRSRAGGS
jgi:hypothetical protein